MSAEGGDLWIIVPNWSKFQHYDPTVRNPPWIKVYTEINSRDDFLSLSPSGRGLLLTIWVEFARSAGKLRVSTLLKLGGPHSRYAHLQPLVDAGFIQLTASTPALAPRALARSREEVEEEKSLSPKEEKPKSEKPRQSDYSPKANVTPKDPSAAIAAMIRNGAIRDPVDLEAELAGSRLEPGAEDELRALFELTAVVTSLGGGA